MEINDLEKVLNEIPILLVDACFINNVSENEYTLRGISVRKHREDGSFLSYTVLNKDCDDMVYTLLHESLHHHYRDIASEEFIEDLTDYHWEDIEQRKLCQDKVVELLDWYNL